MPADNLPTPPPPLPSLLGLPGIRLRVRALPRLLHASLTRRYRYHGLDTLLVAAAAVFYALHPGDDWHFLLQHFGIGDDLLVLGIAGRWINCDLEEFLALEAQAGRPAQATGQPP